jgi:hypothetical protein
MVDCVRITTCQYSDSNLLAAIRIPLRNSQIPSAQWKGKLSTGTYQSLLQGRIR